MGDLRFRCRFLEHIVVLTPELKFLVGTISYSLLPCKLSSLRIAISLLLPLTENRWRHQFLKVLALLASL